MSYTPTSWENGDTITAEGLNNIERGVADIDSGYTPTVWQTGDIITAEKLNKIEQGIADAAGSAITVESLSVSSNGTYTATAGTAYSPVSVSVANSYSAGDEGKVVKNGALASQGSATYNSNGTYDTTDISSVTVSVSGPVAVAEKDVNFYDYDGTCVAAYSAADFAALDALPSNPSHDGLTAQGWNWTLSDAKTYVASYGFLDIGQNYTTSDGKTRIYIHLVDQITSPCLGICPKGTVTVDWGDGSATSTLTGTSLSTLKTVTHSYAAPGDYVITLDPGENDSFSFYGTTSSSQILTADGTAGSGARPYLYSVVGVQIGVRATIGQYSFLNCEHLQFVTIPSTVTSFGQSAFRNCKDLKCAHVPSGVTSTGTYAFDSCYILDVATIPKGLSIGNNAFANCYKVRKIATSSTSSYGTNAFQSCLSLEKTVLPSGITSIGSTSYSGCSSLPRFVIPSTVTSIAANAFANCYSMGTLRFEGSAPTVANSNAFTYLPVSCLIFVPFSGLAGYLGGSNYPSTATYTYLGFATYTSGNTLPAQDSTSAYNVTWYASVADAKAGTNPITQGNGNEVYCTWTAV